METCPRERVTLVPHMMTGGNHSQPVKAAAKKKTVEAGEADHLPQVEDGTLRQDLKVAVEAGELLLMIENIQAVVDRPVTANTTMVHRLLDGIANPAAAMSPMPVVEAFLLPVDARVSTEIVRVKIRTFPNGPTRTSRTLPRSAEGSTLVGSGVAALTNPSE